MPNSCVALAPFWLAVPARLGALPRTGSQSVRQPTSARLITSEGPHLPSIFLPTVPSEGSNKQGRPFFLVLTAYY